MSDPTHPRGGDRRNDVEDFLRLSKEIAEIAARLGTVNRPTDGHAGSTPAQRLVLARAMLSTRRRIGDYFADSLFADAPRDILLDLYVAACTGRQITISSACIAAAVPATTALRWVSRMTDEGTLISTADIADARRRLVRLSPEAFKSFDAYLDASVRLLRPVFAS